MSCSVGTLSPHHAEGASAGPVLSSALERGGESPSSQLVGTEGEMTHLHAKKWRQMNECTRK